MSIKGTVGDIQGTVPYCPLVAGRCRLGDITGDTPPLGGVPYCPLGAAARGSHA